MRRRLWDNHFQAHKGEGSRCSSVGILWANKKIQSVRVAVGKSSQRRYGSNKVLFNSNGGGKGNIIIKAISICNCKGDGKDNSKVILPGVNSFEGTGADVRPLF